MHHMEGSITAPFDIFKSKITEFQRDLQKSSSTASKPSLATEFDVFKSFIGIAFNTLQRQIHILCIEMDALIISILQNFFVKISDDIGIAINMKILRC